MTVNVFVGPYVEVIGPVGDHNLFFRSTVPEKDVEGLFNDGRLKWNLGDGGGPRTIDVRGQPMWQHCGVPIEERRGIPRRQMYSKLAFPATGDGVVIDWDQVDPEGELGWFRSAFAEELQLLARVLGEPPTIRWGLVMWVR